jgi:hypothetical protein
MIRRPDPQHRLHRALAASAACHGLTLHPVTAHERPWSSATFTGWRLTLDLAIAGGDPGDWLAALPEEDLPVPGRLVADLAVTHVAAARATLAVLLLESGADFG